MEQHVSKYRNQFCSVEIFTTEKVCEIITHISYKGANVENKMSSLEGFIVQDADRLDAIGAIGIGRAFAYGGYKDRPMYDPELPPQIHSTFEQYKNSKSATINHFYEKLLLLKDMMNTSTAKRIAEQRHEVMVKFLDQFMKEWDGEVIFLHEVGKGAADRSYGVQVAKLAGLPAAVIERAKAVLHQLEADGSASKSHKLIDDLPLFSAEVRQAPKAAKKTDVLGEALGAVNPDDLSPKEALELVYRLKHLAAQK